VSRSVLEAIGVGRDDVVQVMARQRREAQPTAV
jgi:hypothetical protein